MSTFSKPIAAVLLTVIFVWWILLCRMPDFTGFVRILSNLAVTVLAAWLMWVIWSRSDWNPNSKP